MAEHATKVAPHVYKVLFENEHVRLLEATLQAGDKTDMHSHPGNLIYSISPGKVKFTDPSGEVTEVELAAGDSMWMDATEHGTENVGGTTVTALLIEPK